MVKESRCAGYSCFQAPVFSFQGRHFLCSSKTYLHCSTCTENSNTWYILAAFWVNCNNLQVYTNLPLIVSPYLIAWRNISYFHSLLHTYSVTYRNRLWWISIVSFKLHLDESMKSLQSFELCSIFKDIFKPLTSQRATGLFFFMKNEVNLSTSVHTLAHLHFLFERIYVFPFDKSRSWIRSLSSFC